MSEYRTPRRAFRAMFARNFLEKTVEIVKKGYILGVLLLFGCGTVDSSPENYPESYAENGEILTVFMSTEFENGSTVRDQAKIQLIF